MEKISEAELIEQARSDPEAFCRLYEANYSAILNYIYRRALNVEIAEELTSNTFFKALRALPKYRKKAPFRAWLYRIATNEIRMYRRSIARRLASEHNPGWVKDLERIYFAPHDRDDAQNREEKMRQYERLHQSLTELPERYQTVLVLKYFEGLRNDEIAEALGKRLGTVKSLIHRGLKKLRSLMEGKNATFH